ncbi:MAG: multidrug efflux MFS transporter [Nocardiopsaceae bacterium]|nr:multidrug efflux MFS transporter [Nocardiopsaceae bacterium]
MTATQPSKPHALDPELRQLALVVVAGTIMTILDSTIVNVALTPLGRQFHTSLSTIQWVLTSYGLALAMVIPLTGWAVERFGAKRTWITSLLVFIVGSAACGAAWNVASLIVFRVVQGIGGGMVIPVGQMMAARKAGPDRMARMLGVVAVPSMIGPLLGPVIGGLILENLSWQWMFYINVPLCAVALVLAVRLLPGDTGHRADRKIDAIGLALLSPGVAFLVYGLSKASVDNRQLGIWTAAGLACVTTFILRARRTDAPLISVRAFTRRAFAVCAGAMFVYLGALYGFMVVLPVYFQVVRSQSPLSAGLLLAPLTLGAGLTMAASGRLAHRISARWTIVAGIVVVAAGAVAFTRLGPGTSLLLVAGMLFVTSLGHGAILPTGMGAAYQGMPKAEIPAATATFNVVFRVASSFGTAVLAVVVQQSIRSRIPGAASLADAARLHGAPALAALTGAFAVSFWWVAALAGVSVIPALFIPGRGGASMASLLAPGPGGDDSGAEPQSSLLTE